MHHQEVAPPPALQDLIHCFWYDRFDFGPQPVQFDVPPDGYAEIIFYVGSPCRLATPTGWQPLPSPFLLGLLPHPAQLTTKDRFEIIGIRCFPWTVFDLLGLPPAPGNVLLGEHPIAQLQVPLTQYLQAGNVAAALAEAARYFGQPRSPLEGERLLGKAGQAMRDATGTLPVHQVAAAAHATVRTLERTFKQAAAHTVKDVSSLLRFEQVRNCLLLYPTTNIARLAYALGYTDQSHLSREFKRYSGTTPAAFARKALNRGATIRPDCSAFIEP
ncbi:AraC family transcriptional regulator (plasmid) [Hymenobacter sp. NBH84]|uniref:helix-turn-helix domain-containing protein n=1 Tax=Hymenobacter sp. NBH84 TaxID=2596915 RepID=UPI001626F9F8|nr:helix-turn-helix domain-containing protein [Hymenobacter sp. NBH84]QNE42349.1 AraC family transcriptional regulator [Hymenobacter sp. NBH84]